VNGGDKKQSVAGARSRLAELEVEFNKEKSRVDAVQASLFQHLCGHYQKRDQLRLVVEYRQKFLDSFLRDDPDEVEQAENDLKQAKAQLDKDYENLATVAGEKKNFTVVINHEKDTGDIEALQKEIAAVAESLKELRASPDYELCQLAEKKPGMLDELAVERAKQLEIENAELELQAEKLAEEIEKVSKSD
jgi:uncharacterized iron-regulated protein